MNIEIATINLTDIIAIIAFIWMGFNIHGRIDTVNKRVDDHQKNWVETSKILTELVMKIDRIEKALSK